MVVKKRQKEGFHHEFRLCAIMAITNLKNSMNMRNLLNSLTITLIVNHFQNSLDLMNQTMQIRLPKQ